MFCTLLSFARSLHGLLLIALHGSMESMEGSIPRKLELVRIAHRLPPFTKETRQYLIWDAEGSEETVDVVTSKLFSAADEEEPSKKDEKEKKKKKKSPSKKQKKSKKNEKGKSKKRKSTSSSSSERSSSMESTPDAIDSSESSSSKVSPG